MVAGDLEFRAGSLASKAFDGLRAAIVCGVFRPGDALREPDPVERFGISRTPLREALRRLDGVGLVDLAPRLGARVRRLSLDEARELHELRRILEGTSAEFAAGRADRSTLAELWSVIDDSTTRSGPTPRSLPVNQGFHEGIARNCGNAHLAGMILNTIDLISLWRMGALDRGAAFRGTVEDHRKILTAIEAGEARQARHLMEAHIDASREASHRMMGREEGRS